MKLKKILGNKMFSFVACVLFLTLSALYFYGLQCGYPPEPESIMSVSSLFSHLTRGTEYHITEFLYSACALLAVEIGGMSYFSTRLFYTLLYMILLSGVMFLCLKPKDGHNAKLYLLPLIGLLSVLLFPVADNAEIFQWPAGVELIYVWPYVYHCIPQIYTVLCLVVLLILIQCREKKRQIVYSIVLAVICLYAMKTADLIFYVMFLAPLFIVAFLHTFYKADTRKYAIYLMSGGMVILFLSKILRYAAKGSLWTKERMHVYGRVHGGTNWVSIDSLGITILGYIKIVAANFNIQLPGAPVLSLHTIVAVFKIAIVIIGYLIIFHIIKCSLSGRGKSYQYDYIDEITAWSYLILSGISLFTELGGSVINNKYFCGMTFLMTIILCRNIETFLTIINIETLKELKYKKELFCAYTFVLCVCSMGKVWTYHAPDGYEADFEAITQYIEGTDYGYAVAPLWLYPQIYAKSGGEVMIFRKIEEIRNIFGDDAKISYIVTNDDDNYEVPENVYVHCSSEEEIREYYSEPTDVIHYDKLKLLIFKDGIKIEE